MMRTMFRWQAPKRRVRKACDGARGRQLVFEVMECRALLSTIPGTMLVQVTQNPGPAPALTLSAADDGVTLQVTTVKGWVQARGTPASVAAFAAAVGSMPDVASVTPEVSESTQQTPNDPSFTNGALYGLNGANGINAPAAWNVTTGSGAVVVADIDTGINYDHPDLAQNIWINQAEIPASRMKNLTDVYHDGYISWRDLNNPINQGPGKITDVNGDGVIDAADILAPMVTTNGKVGGPDSGMGGWANGSIQDGDTAHVDDLIGWNFVTNTNNPLDDNGHGTHTAGTIGAVGNNGVGVVGVNWNVSLMALKFIDGSGSGSDVGAAEAIEYSAAHGARVSNNSYGGTQPSAVMEQAIQDAGKAGDVFVAAAGNSGTNNDTSPFYPAAFTDPNVIDVAATDGNGNLASFSNYGKSVDVGAPGVNILSTYPTNSYAYLSGTSMATPHVTGTIALLLAVHPTWTYQQLINQVESTATPDPSLAGRTLTGGLLNAGAALTSASSTPVLADAGFESPSVGAGAFGDYAYGPAGTPWTYAGQAGVAGNGSGFTVGNPAAPEGSQVAFLEAAGSAAQSVAGWSAGSYVVSFQAAQRSNYQPSREDFAVTVDGQTVGTFTPGSGSYATYATAAFAVGAGSHTVGFVGLDTAGGDNTALIDAVKVTRR